MLSLPNLVGVVAEAISLLAWWVSGQSGTGRDKLGQVRTDRGRWGQSRQVRTGRDRSGQDMTRQEAIR